MINLYNNEWFFDFSYEERNRSLDTVSSRHKESKTFEEFVARIYSPIPNIQVIAPVPVSSSTITAAALIDQQHQPHQRSSVKNNSNSSSKR